MSDQVWIINQYLFSIMVFLHSDFRISTAGLYIEIIWIKYFRPKNSYGLNTGFKGTVLNPPLPSLHWGSLEITLTKRLKDVFRGGYLGGDPGGGGGGGRESSSLFSSWVITTTLTFLYFFTEETN